MAEGTEDAVALRNHIIATCEKAVLTHNKSLLKCAIVGAGATGVELAAEALKSSTQRDSASGNGIDIYALTKEGIKHAISQKITSTFN